MRFESPFLRDLGLKTQLLKKAVGNARLIFSKQLVAEHYTYIGYTVYHYVLF